MSYLKGVDNVSVKVYNVVGKKQLMFLPSVLPYNNSYVNNNGYKKISTVLPKF